MAVLNRFISWPDEKGLPFFKLLKKTSKFEWIEEAKEAFEKLKAYLITSPILTPPKKHEAMMLYVLATTMVVSVAIVVGREEEGHMYKV
jgi:prephenate dehydrogenase